jgi:predicted hydrocarbon binding protein
VTEEIPESLFQKYHVALVKTLGEDAQKIFVKLGRELGSKITNKEKNKPKRAGN